ncbi:arylsulfotransferase family protein [Yinghuangia soli]|uniref:LGFP repeat-containing protein n=1 Tax=Yinghuangia soli TaxID=2908204 RepID=A0AA41PXY4_9ACTN|nr:arylsulfotransferase family protein [Yinghuangia soli]MCF2526869.1 hypothetical protein [Yinghuangia soli]
MSNTTRRALTWACSSAVLSTCLTFGLASSAAAAPPIGAGTGTTASAFVPGAGLPVAPQTITPPPASGWTGRYGYKLTPIATRVVDGAAPGLLFGGNPSADPVQNASYIYDNDGRIVYSNQSGENLTRINYLGRPAVANNNWWSWIIEDADGKTLRTIAMPDLASEQPSIRTNADGTKALITFQRPASVDLSGSGGPSKATVLESVLREVDLATGGTTFEWASLKDGAAQVPLTDSLVGITPGLDYVGLNGASYAQDGSILASASGTGSVYKFDRATGGFAWILGGKRNQFAFTGTSAEPSRPLDVSVDGSGRLSFLDDSAAKSARSVAYTLDEDAKTAALSWSWTPEDPVSDVKSGGNQVLPNGNRLITFGAKGAVAEVTPNGTVVFESQLPAGVPTQRVQRESWTTGRPEFRVHDVSMTTGKLDAVAIWNGASGVASWQLSTGPDKDHLTPVGTLPYQGVVSEIKATLDRTTAGYVLTALDSEGKPLPSGTSQITYIDEIAKLVAELPDPSVMGTPTTFAKPVGAPQAGATMRDFTQGLGYIQRSYWSSTTALIYGPLADAYKAQGGPTGPLGAPIGPMAVYSDGGSAVPLAGETVLVYSPGKGTRVLKGGFALAWRGQKDPLATLGYPVGDAVRDPSGTGCVQDFALAKLYAASCDTGAAAAVPPAVAARWEPLKSLLGYPVTGAYDDNGTTVQRFERGAITVASNGTTRLVFGAIYQEWLANTYLGLPTTDELAVGDGIGRVSHFARGSIYWSPQSGAHALQNGGIHTKWLQLGGPTGFLGYPTDSEHDFKEIAGTGARTTTFQRGIVVWTAATGPHEMHGGVLQTWRDSIYRYTAGYPGGAWIGFPLTDETATGSRRGIYQVFQRGAVFWSPNSGAAIIRGGMAEKWASQNWDSGWLGFPTTNEWPMTDRPGVVVQYFERGRIYWSADRGARMVPDALDPTRWISLNLGLPIQDVQYTADGTSQYVIAERGALYATHKEVADNGFADIVMGGIWAKYQSIGADRSCLGLPWATEHNAWNQYGTPDGSMLQSFANGTIVWNSVTGVSTARCGKNGKPF